MSRILKNVKGMSVEEWRKLRKNSIGGSDAATVLGLNNFSSRYSLWADKKGLLPEKNETEAMKIGHDLEQYVAMRWSEATGKKFHRDNNMYLHDDYDFLSANIDRKVVGENAGLECKTTNAFNKSDFENGEIPLYYYCQCMHYMNVCGFDRMYLAVLVMGRAFYHFVIERDEKEIESLQEKEIEFWRNYVEKNEPPEIDGSDSTFETLKLIYPEGNSFGGESIYIDDDLDELGEIKAQIKELTAQEKELQNRIIGILKSGETEYGHSDKFTVTYKAQKKTSFDSKKFKEDCPSMYDKYAKQSECRVMRIKEIKDREER